ncbi:hypothetical protein HHK36_030451 [Tetracentron sinense]|uniref:Receptor-like serine/threonine-protein kinase n=1 Tax=Tetracentron sinense TaxID=13715 RepID=A0A834Y7H5_TETSI|nr:hypothetical protein HHK36_030451 [Tetracentron sinense]
MRIVIVLQSYTILCSIFLSNISINAVDTITPTQTVRDGETLVSSKERFELGFFTPGNSKNRYVGIWYKQITIPTIVWVANRDNPITNSSGILTISDKGNLMLLNQGATTVIWSSNHDLSKADNPVAQLLDSGNLVIREANDEDPHNYLWQSFDHPTHTMLPGMKLGWNSKTGMNRSLTSWKSEDDPSTGDYSLMIDPHGSPETYLLHRLVRRYRSGPWNGHGFNGIPDMKPNYIFNLDFTSSQEEVYYSFSLKNESLYSRMLLIHTGLLHGYTWLETSSVWNLFWIAPKDQCDNYRECGAYGICDINTTPVCNCVKGFKPKNPNDWYLRDGSSGCIKKSEFDCHDKSYGFLTMKGMKLPDTSHFFADKSMTLKECEAVCRKNCSCTAYANSDIAGGGTGCVIWTGDLMDLREFTQGGQDLYVRVAASELGTYNFHKFSLKFQILVGDPQIIHGMLRTTNDSGKKKRVVVTVSVTVGVGVLLFGLSARFIRKKTKKRGTREKNLDPLLFENKKDDLDGYMSPEYAMDGLFSVKSDIFSFGVLVLEIISGKKNRGFYNSDNLLNLLGHVWRLWTEGRAIEALDSSMADSCPTYEVLRCIQIGLLCIQEHAEDRPTISSVILMLSSENAILPQPKKPGFCLGTIPSEIESSSSKIEACSMNQVTITMLEAR